MCIFCKIINQEIPCYQVYEDEETLAFLDIRPVNPGHTLVVPKTHVASLEEISARELQGLILTVKKIGQMLKTKLNIPGYNIVLNNDPVAGQEIPHLHFHVIPRHPHDNLKLFPQAEQTVEAAENILKKLLN